MAKVEWTIKAIKQLKKIDSRYRKIVTEKGNALSGFPNVDMDIVRLIDRKKMIFACALGTIGFYSVYLMEYQQ